MMMKDAELTDTSRTGSLIPTPYLFVLAAVLLWSTGGVFIKLTTVDAFSVNLGRSFFAALTVAVYLHYKKALQFDWFSIFSGLFYAGTLATFVYANKHTTAANAIFLQYTAPVYILIFAPFILKEKFRALDVVTVVACITGMTLFFMDSQPNGISAADNTSGIIAGLISGLCFGLYFVLLRHPRGRKHNPALSVLTGNIIIVLVMLPIVLSDPPAPTSYDFVGIAYLGIIQIGIAYILFTYGVANGVRSLDASIIGFVEPLLNPVWVILIVGEVPTIWAVIGGLIIISSVIFHTLAANYRKRMSKRVELL